MVRRGGIHSPNNSPSVHCMYQALRAVPKGLKLIFVGYLNMRLGNPRDEREEDLTTAISDRGLVNMTDHFLTRRQYRGVGGWTWIIQRDG